MKSIFFALAFTGLISCTSSPKQSVSPCITLQLDCFGTGPILIVGDATEQGNLLTIAEAATESFETIFGIQPAKAVIVPGGVISAEQNKGFKEAGYPISLPWLSAADKAKFRESSIRAQVEAQTKDLPEAVRAAAMSQALSASGASETDQASDTIQAGAFSHELGHLWFMEAFKPADAEAQTGHAYGGWAPDWLDETAAILMENPELIKKRRQAFKAMSNKELVPLDTFLTMEHPAAQSAKRLSDRFGKNREDGEVKTVFLTGKEAEAFLKDSGGDKAANFYTQVQAFSDFLLSYSNDTRLYTSLANDLLAGQSFETWLTSKGSRWDLPDSRLQLDEDWQNWVKVQTED